MKLKRILVLLFLVTGVFFLWKRSVMAAGECTGFGGSCPTGTEIEAAPYNLIDEALNLLDIRKTATNAATAVAMNWGSIVVFGQGIGELSDCIDGERENITNGNISGPVCKMGSGEVVDANLGGNSLASFAVNTYDTVLYRDNVLPVNLAYYTEDVARRVPFLQNSAYAIEESEFFAGELVLGMWKVTRNLAYGLLSLVALVIGFMIMMRKSVNPQTVVTLQAAIPRLVIGIVLITFSYPIGATVVGLLAPLRRLGDTILNSAAEAAQTPGTNIGGAGLVGAIILAILISSGIAALASGGTAVPFLAGIGVFTFIFVILAFLVWILVLLVALLKAGFIYFKILVSIVASPIVFALGAIPGNEQMTTNWFKLLGARLLAIPAMYTLIATTGLLIRSLLSTATPLAGVDYFSGVLETTILWLMIPFACISLMAIAISVPKKIEDAIMGKKGR